MHSLQKLLSCSFVSFGWGDGIAFLSHRVGSVRFPSAKPKPFLMVWLQIRVNQIPFQLSTHQTQAKNEANSERSLGETKLRFLIRAQIW